MSFCLQVRENTLFDERRDPFAAAMGARRGLSVAQRTVLAQAEAEAKELKPFSGNGEEGGTVISYFRGNDAAVGILHREDGPARIATMPDGARTEEYWQNGHLQRDQGPARIRYSAGGVITRSEWHQLAVGAAASRCHREDGPAVLADDPVLGTHTEEYYVGGQRHREDGPAYSLIADNGYSNSSYYRNGELHREDGPAVSTVDSESDFGTEGSVTEEWYREGQLHREDGPAQITTFTKGARTECYYLRGLKHREDGPASIKYRENGTIAYQLWFRGGKPQSSSRWHRFSAGFLGAKSIPRASRQRR